MPKADLRAADNPWAEGDGTYLCQFFWRKMNELAAILRSKFGNIGYRYNGETRRMEFYEPDGSLAADAYVEGECCLPSIAKVRILTLPREARLFFIEAFSFRNTSIKFYEPAEVQ